MTTTDPLASYLSTARASHRAGYLRRALDDYEVVLRQSPDHADALFGSAKVLTDLGAIAASVSQLEKARRAAPDRADIAFALAASLSEAGRLSQSEAAYHAAIALDTTPKATLDFAVGMRNLGRLSEAEAALGTVLAHTPAPQLWLALSDVLVDRYRMDDAVDACRAAIVLATHAAAAHLRLGTRLAEGGRTDAARRAFARCTVIEPTGTVAPYSLARLTRHTRASAPIAQLDALANAPAIPPRRRADAHFALFKVHDDLDEVDTAFEHLTQANDLIRRQVRYASDADRAYFDRVRQAFEPMDLTSEAAPDAPGQCQIFVVGLPRSGSTLVEQILASHPLVHGAGEIQNLRRELLRGLEAVDAANYGFPEGVERLNAAHWHAVGRAYEASLEPTGRPVTVNKTPGNFQMVPAIWRALPKARIIHCRRAPMDACFSMYRHSFVGWGFLYAYDQQEVATAHGIHDRFVAHWQARRPEGLHTLSYEALVADTETEVRRLLAYCGLPWDDRCLDFASNPRAVRTASLAQVRQPIHANAIGSWKRYATHLSAMRDQLLKEGLDAG